MNPRKKKLLRKRAIEAKSPVQKQDPQPVVQPVVEEAPAPVVEEAPELEPKRRGRRSRNVAKTE